MPVTHCVLMGGVPGFDLWTYRPGLKPLLGMKVWANYINLVSFAFGWMRLDDMGDNPYPGEGIPLAPTGPIYGYYWPLQRGLEKHGWTVISPSIDWRRKMEYIGPRLADWLISWKSRWPLVGVFHSAGGIMLRFALKWINVNYKTEEVFHRIVSLDTPHWGSWFATGSLTGHLGYANSVVDLKRLPSWIPINTKGKTLQAYIKDVSASFPSVYQMLPCPGAPGLTDEVANKLYDPQTWTDAGNPVNDYLLGYAKSEWATVSHKWEGPPWLAIGSTGLPTPVDISDWDELGLPSGLKYLKEGDGVVPKQWAALPGMQVGSYTGKDHDQVAQDTEVAEAANNFFNSP